MRHLYLFLLLVAASVMPAMAQSFTTRCESQVTATPVVVTTASIGYTVDNTLPHKTIAGMAGPPQRDTFILGLTRAQFNTRISYSGMLVRDNATQTECLLPSIGVSLQYQTMKVYVGREFPEGSCAYQKILAHELRHVQAFQDHLPEVEATVAQTMSKHFARPMYAPMGQSQSRLRTEIDTVWKPFILGEQRKVDLLQKQVDSPEESREVARSCDGQVRQVILESRRHPVVQPSVAAGSD